MRAIRDFVVIFSLLQIASAPIPTGPKSDHHRTLRDPSADQLENFRRQTLEPSIARISSGAPVDSESASLTVGPRGPILLQDTTLIDALSHLHFERIPDRIVHAKGAGAFGYFEITHDITRFTKAVVFAGVGKRTDLAVRFSFGLGERGSPDTQRDIRGFALKFYTEEGNWDLVGNNFPVFFIRDPMLFQSSVHSQKRNPVTNLLDADMFWDFISLRPEATYMAILRSTDGGIPDGYRYMAGHGIHTFKLVNAVGEVFWCKFHYQPELLRNLTNEEAQYYAGTDPDYATRDLYNAIQEGNFPTWTFYVQIMPYKDAFTYRYDPFDPTKEWPPTDYPYLPVGKLVLNRNPTNYFTEVEQIAFSPGRLIPGIEASPDRLLQGRMFAYPNTQFHRLGPNNQQLPVNCPYRVRETNYQRDGPATIYNQGGAPNYYPNSFNGPQPDPLSRISPFPVEGVVDRYESGDENDFEQSGVLWRNRLTEGERGRLVSNLVNSLTQASSVIQERVLANFVKVDPIFAARVQEGLTRADSDVCKGASENL